MKHTSSALVRLLVSISVIIILASAVLPQQGSWVDARHRGSDVENQNDVSSSTSAPIQPASDKSESVSTTSDIATDSTSASSESSPNADPIQSDSDIIELISTTGDTATDSTAPSDSSLILSESDNIEPVSTTSGTATDSTSSTGSSISNSSYGSASSSGAIVIVPLQPASSDKTASSSFVNNGEINDSISNTSSGGSSDGETLLPVSSQSESGGSESSNGTSLESVESGSSLAPASEGSGSSATNSSSIDGQPTDVVSSTEPSIQISNDSSSVVGSGSANQSSSEGNLTATSGSSNTPASHPMEDNSTTASASSHSDLGVDANEIVTVSSSSNPNAVEQTISNGSGTTRINYGNVNNVDNVSATISLDKPSYNPGDSPIISLNDPEANVDPNQANTIQVNVSSSSDKAGILITLTETGINTGVFQGAFSFTSGDSSSPSGLVKVAAGDNIGISYEGSHPRMEADIGGVQQGGNVEMIQVPDPELKPTYFIGGAVHLTFGEEVVLAPNWKTQEIKTQCDDFGIPQSECNFGVAAGEITIKMSYANAPLNGQDPNTFSIWQFVNGTGWVDLSKHQPLGSEIQKDFDKQTVTAYTPYQGGIFIIGVAAPPGGGGGGGGLGFPGAGIVLDFLAPVTAETPPPTTGPPSTTSPSPKTSSPAATGTSDNETSGSIVGQTTGSGQKNNEIGSGTSASSASQLNSPASTTTSGAFNTIIAVPGIGNVTLSFSNLGSERSFVVWEVKSESELAALKISKAASGDTKVLMASDSTPYDVVGPVFNIGPFDAKVNGTVTVTIPYNSTLAPEGGDSVRMLQFVGNAWEDVTTNPPADGHVVTGSLNGLGPVVAAIKSK